MRKYSIIYTSDNAIFLKKIKNIEKNLILKISKGFNAVKTGDTFSHSGLAIALNAIFIIIFYIILSLPSPPY